MSHQLKIKLRVVELNALRTIIKDIIISRLHRPRLFLNKGADAIEDQIMDTLNSKNNDDPIMNILSNDNNDESMYDTELGNDIDIIENKTSPLIFDFSQPAPAPDKDNIIKDFDISHNAYEIIVKHFNSILEMSTCITYKACTPHLGKKLLKCFSGVEEIVYNICQRGCIFFTSLSQSECSSCGQSQYKTRCRETERSDLVSAAIMLQLLLAKQLALASANKNIKNTYLKLLLTSGKIKINIFTINQHLLQHYSLIIDVYSPPRTYSARFVEQAIDEYSRAIKNFYGSKAEECNMIEAAMQTNCKTFFNGCVINSALDQNYVREAHNIRLQIQFDKNHNIHSAYSPVYKDFFGKVFVFFEHKLNNKRWPLAFVEIAAVRLVNDISVVNNMQMKLKVVHLADVKELVGLVKLDATINTITTTATTYVVWPELNCGLKLLLDSLTDL
ncbi:hypothetical protein PHYBLDRAFT_170395 [Phycomyces blakesleeanus NRRL 1555(-)]|uniref:Uncharacterized protein n=1 Tax=Phycomyces blakesleeanus (strain ATCC 8743b / DSM 1359 / FGSC 10004 / NBRC 33097 / NRRL 1555) TaxID=763407 RepID=A0A162U259_PHYB8|nr:hypothetical protein PHYBLDRAFT_170395 [Phycomyces blakesleeanus NRRL 1555(-)]OAD71733.1 hypothetical protein PHYBLDRAFT_170395 [Phycomyces blakesleeanus NRRL 1555(-)]|eukprot:XP_018289773.1 hypothetical protein PHYBLDRAFT_170395 [Phycomyces blakesleeanus NRRL 1555(-)]